MKDGSTPLLFAAYNGHAFVTKQLIEFRCNIDLQQNDGVTPVYIAAQRAVMRQDGLVLNVVSSIRFPTRIRGRLGLFSYFTLSHTPFPRLHG